MSPKIVSKDTLDEYNNAVAKWLKLIGDSDLKKINERTIGEFVARAETLPGVKPGTTQSPNTIRKDLRYVHAILALALKKGKIREIPYFPLPRETFRNARDAYTYEEMVTIIRATSCMESKSISSIPAHIWWKNFLIFFYNTGLRLSTALAARWDWIDTEHDRLEIARAEKVKTIYEVPLNRSAIDVIAAMRKLHEQDNIFPWDKSYYFTSYQNSIDSIECQ